MWVNDSLEDLSLLQHKSYLFNYTELNTQGSVSGNEEESEIGSKMSSWTKKKANLVHFQKWNMLYQCINLNQQPPTNENKKQREVDAHCFYLINLKSCCENSYHAWIELMQLCEKKVTMVRYLHCCKSAVLKELKNLPDMVKAQCKVTLWESSSLCNLICPLLVFFLFCPLILCICMSAPFFNFLCFFYLPCSLHLSHSVSLLHLQLH